jgi:hypothetical protein
VKKLLVDVLAGLRQQNVNNLATVNRFVNAWPTTYVNDVNGERTRVFAPRFFLKERDGLFGGKHIYTDPVIRFLVEEHYGNEFEEFKACYKREHDLATALGSAKLPRYRIKKSCCKSDIKVTSHEDIYADFVNGYVTLHDIPKYIDDYMPNTAGYIEALSTYSKALDARTAGQSALVDEYVKELKKYKFIPAQGYKVAKLLGMVESMEKQSMKGVSSISMFLDPYGDLSKLDTSNKLYKAVDTDPLVYDVVEPINEYLMYHKKVRTETTLSSTGKELTKNITYYEVDVKVSFVDSSGIYTNVQDAIDNCVSVTDLNFNDLSSLLYSYPTSIHSNPLGILLIDLFSRHTRNKLDVPKYLLNAVKPKEVVYSKTFVDRTDNVYHPAVEVSFTVTLSDILYSGDYLSFLDDYPKNSRKNLSISYSDGRYLTEEGLIVNLYSTDKSILPDLFSRKLPVTYEEYVAVNGEPSIGIVDEYGVENITMISRSKLSPTICPDAWVYLPDERWAGYGDGLTSFFKGVYALKYEALTTSTYFTLKQRLSLLYGKTADDEYCGIINTFVNAKQPSTLEQFVGAVLAIVVVVIVVVLCQTCSFAMTIVLAYLAVQIATVLVAMAGMEGVVMGMQSIATVMAPFAKIASIYLMIIGIGQLYDSLINAMNTTAANMLASELAAGSTEVAMMTVEEYAKANIIPVLLNSIKDVVVNQISMALDTSTSTLSGAVKSLNFVADVVKWQKGNEAQEMAKKAERAGKEAAEALEKLKQATEGRNYDLLHAWTSMYTNLLVTQCSNDPYDNRYEAETRGLSLGNIQKSNIVALRGDGAISFGKLTML